jgi:radical SAM superfamily enzyme YgiQ (UPF0313 family)
VKKDLDAAKAMTDLIEALARKLGGLDWVARLIEPYYVYNKELAELNQNELGNLQSIANVFKWLRSGAKSAFLQDANTPIMRTPHLVEIIRYLKQLFPSLQSVTSYGRAKTVTQKTLEELKDLHKAGLSRLYIGLETGDNDLLKYVNKGATSEEQILAGIRVKEVGIELSEYWMPGLGGKKFSEQHAKNTAKVLNAINPDFVRSRRFVPRKGTPLFDEWKKREFQLLSPYELLREIEMMIKSLNITGRICFDHFSNPAFRSESGYIWLFKQDYDGYKLPEEKSKILKIIEKGLEISESIYMTAEDLVDVSL